MAFGRRKHEAEAPEPRRATVLVVSDDPGARELLRRLLAGAGHEPSVCGSVDEAVSIAAQHRPDAIVADLAAGGLNANLTLIDRVRHHGDPAVRDARVVLIGPHRRAQVLSWQAGIDGFLVRPFPAAALLAELQAGLAAGPAERAERRQRRIAASG